MPTETGAICRCRRIDTRHRSRIEPSVGIRASSSVCSGWITLSTTPWPGRYRPVKRLALLGEHGDEWVWYLVNSRPSSISASPATGGRLHREATAAGAPGRTRRAGCSEVPAASREGSPRRCPLPGGRRRPGSGRRALTPEGGGLGRRTPQALPGRRPPPGRIGWQPWARYAAKVNAV